MVERLFEGYERKKHDGTQPSIQENVAPKSFGGEPELKILILGKQHVLRGRLVSVWNEITVPAASDARRISELSGLIGGAENHMSEEHVKKIIESSSQRLLGYPQHFRVYKPAGVVQGFTLAEVDDKTKAVDILQTAVAEDYQFGVGFALRAKLVQDLEVTGHRKFFGRPNEKSRRGFERGGFEPVVVEISPGQQETFYAFGMTPRDVLYENIRRRLVQKLMASSAEEKRTSRDVIGKWAEYNKYVLDESSYGPILKPVLGHRVARLPPESLASRINDDLLMPAMLNPETQNQVRWRDNFEGRNIPLPVGFNPIDDFVENMVRYQMEGHNFRDEAFDKLKSGDPALLRRYVLLRSKLFNGKEFGVIEGDIAISSSYPARLKRGQEVLMYPPQ